MRCFRQSHGAAWDFRRQHEDDYRLSAPSPLYTLFRSHNACEISREDARSHPSPNLLSCNARQISQASGRQSLIIPLLIQLIYQAILGIAAIASSPLASAAISRTAYSTITYALVASPRRQEAGAGGGEYNENILLVKLATAEGVNFGNKGTYLNESANARPKRIIRQLPPSSLLQNHS